MTAVRPTAALAASAVVVASLGALPAASAQAGEAAPVASTITWRKCSDESGLAGSGAKCATVTVPLDHSDPAGPKIRLAVSRVRHTSSESKYQGVMLLNPGGPGVSGLEFSLLADAVPMRIAKTYDWIGFDPRGVGSSTPKVSCDPKFIGFNRPRYFPRPSANRQAWLARSQRYANACGAKNGQMLAHMTTVDGAHDMEAIRQALGASQINYYGFSYGTYLGQVYSTLFPTHVRRQILDSNVDPTNVFYEANLDQDVAFERNLQSWFKWIAKKPGRWHLGKTRKAVERKFVQTQNRLARHPAKGKLGPDEWIDTFLSVGYTQSAWTDLALRFSAFVRNHKPGPLLRIFRSDQDLGDDNGYAVYNAVQCTDAPWPRHWSTWATDNWATYRKAPLTTWMNAWYNAPCLFWPVPGGAAFDVNGDAAPPTLLVGETRDGATPFQGSLTVRRLYPESSLVSVIGGVNHANSPDGNSCVARWVNRYLDNGRLPQRRQGAGPDIRCQKEVFLG